MLLALWLGGFVHSIIQVYLFFQLPSVVQTSWITSMMFCKPSSWSTWIVLCRNFDDIQQWSNVLLCFLGLVISYAKPEGRTCHFKIPHVWAWHVHLHSLFSAFTADKVTSLCLTVIFSLLNTVIYTLCYLEVDSCWSCLLINSMERRKKKKLSNSITFYISKMLYLMSTSINPDYHICLGTKESAINVINSLLSWR
jgi:olfactory receptor